MTARHLLIFTAVLASPCTAAAQPPRPPLPFEIAIEQTPDSGVIDYDVRIRAGSLFFFRSTLQAPNGRVFDRGFGSMLGADAFDLTFGELLDLVVGEWTIIDREGVPTVPPGSPLPPGQAHTFTVSPFDATDLFTEVPTVVTPNNGATAPSVFDVVWEWPPGTAPPSGVSISLSGANGMVDFTATGDASYQVAIDLAPGLDSDRVRIRAGSQQSLGAFISDATPAGPPMGRMFDPRLSFSSKSEELALTVLAIPEPASGLALLAAVGLGWPLRAPTCVARSCD